MNATKKTGHTPEPWEFANHDSVLTQDDEVLGLVGANGQPVIEIEWGGFACESDPYGSYPILKASDADWALIKAAPALVAACRAALEAMESELTSDDPIAGLKIEWDAETLKKLRAALALAEGKPDPSRRTTRRPASD